MRNFLNLGIKLFPITRSITGKGTLLTLKLLKKEVGALKIKKIKSRTKVYDWVVPDEWNINKAYIKDKFGKKIIDFKKNNLHIVNYSKPFSGVVSKNVLFKHLHSLKNLPNAIPYLTSYYKKYWGFCLKDREKIKLDKIYKENDRFKVLIDTNFNKNGNMHYGEIIIPGKSKEEILISSYICHPSMANNELSGPLLALAIAKYFIKRKNERTLRILFIPETIGSIAYIKRNFEKLKKNVIGGFNLTCVGDERRYSYLASKYGNSYSDRAIIEAYKRLKIKYKKYSFLKRGSDERQYNSPNIDLGIASIMRSKYGTYKEYHTSLDNFNIVTAKGLQQSFLVTKEAIKNLMFQKIRINSYAPKKGNPISTTICEPQLGKRGLYPTLGSRGAKGKPRNILNFIQYADGQNNLNKISKYIKLSLTETKKLNSLLIKNNLIRYLM